MKVTIEKVENGYLVEYPLKEALIPGLTGTHRVIFKEGVDMWAFVMSYLSKEEKKLNEQLKPCPFCGEQPRVIKEIEGDCQIFCVCEHEPMIIMEKSKIIKAIRAWNTRKGGKEIE